MKKINVEELRELFIEIKYGNNIAFEKLYKNYKNLVYKIAYSILKNSYDSDDSLVLLMFIMSLCFSTVFSKSRFSNSTIFQEVRLRNAGRNRPVTQFHKTTLNIKCMLLPVQRGIT